MSWALWDKFPPNTLLKNISKWIDENYNVIDYFQSAEVDTDYQKLKARLLSRRKDVYDQRDLIIYEHFDTDFYDSRRLKSGLSIGNIIDIFTEVDIPLHPLLIYTNHKNLSKEIDSLCVGRHLTDRPKVFETIINRSMVDQIIPWPFDISSIKQHALCVMGQPRSHRHAVYNELYQRDLRRQVYLSYNAYNKK